MLLLFWNFPPEIGGTPTLYYNICKELKSDSFVVVAQKSLGWEQFDIKQNFKIYRINKFSHIDHRIFSEVVFVLHVLIKERISRILFGHINFNLTALIFKFIFRKNYYLYAHGEEISGSFGGKYYRFLKYKSIKHAKGVVAVSDFTANLIRKYNSNVRVIYNAVDAREFRPIPKNTTSIAKYGLQGKKVLLTLSRMEERKGIDKVIKILPRVVNICPEVKYLVVGTGQEEENLKKMCVDFGIQKNVVFIGEIKQEQIVEHYNLCDIFIMPNREVKDKNTEGFGIVFLEANACGKPVIGGNAGGVPSAIKDGYNGFLVDGNNEDDILEKTMLLLKDDQLRERMGQNGLEWVKKFNYKKLVADLESFVK
jgi:phosphatidylinositol alpha-1,6-mannosyltransferase